MKPILMFSGGKYELWLCEKQGGTLRPVTGTFHLSLPSEWQEALNENDRRIEAARGIELDAS